MNVARPVALLDVLDEHLAELAAVWARWSAARRSPTHTQASVLALAERIHGHLEGLLATGPGALPRLGAGLVADDPLEIWAAAYTLLHFRDERIEDLVIDTFTQAEPPALDALGAALARGPLVSPARLQALLDGENALVAATAAIVLAHQRVWTLTSPQLLRLLMHEQAPVRRSGWELVGAMVPQLDPKLYAAAVRDEPGVRLSALEAAAWCGHRGVLAVLAPKLEAPTPDDIDELLLYAAIAPASDLPRFAHIAATPQLGPARFRLIGAFGHPALMDVIIAALASEDPTEATAAGAAYEKMTGFDVESGVVVAVPPADADDQPVDVMLPDPIIARDYWESIRGELGGAPRLCRGADMSKPLDAAAFAAFDMQSRWEAVLRSRFHGAWQGSSLDLDILPRSEATSASPARVETVLRKHP
jgi:hypothetical protein